MDWKEDLNYGLAAFGLKIPDELPLDHLARKLTGQSCRDTASIVAASSVLFFIAERDHNPKVRDIWDALVYCSTCISVGYADIFARTPIGKIIGSTLMTIGPALAAKTLDAPSDQSAGDRQEAVQSEMLCTLRQILAELQSR